MKIHQQLSSRFLILAAAIALVATSVFADSRPSYGTRDGRRDRSDDRGRASRRDISSNRQQPYYAEGRVSRVGRHHDGYRVWISGARYPFFIPQAHFHHDRFRVGLVVRLGGYYNPAGYYDYYDSRYDNRRRGYSRDELRGYVEHVDYRHDRLVIREERTGRRVRVDYRDRYERVRPGDFVELEGDWSRGNRFVAYDVDVLRSGRYRRW